MKKADRQDFDACAREVPEGVDATEIGGWLVLNAEERRRVYIARTHVLQVRPAVDRHDTDRDRVVVLLDRRAR